MSLVSNGSLNENGTQYIGSAARSGALPYFASSSAARSSASGITRSVSHAFGEPAGSGPLDGCVSRSPLHVVERSPRMLIIPRALTWPALGMPTVMPYCCITSGSDAVVSIRPNSIAGPL
jgi:hypothetical protein